MAKGKELSLNEIKRMLAASDQFELLSTGKTTGRPYKSYVALLTQAGSAAPTAVVLENEIGTMVYTRDTTGEYKITCTNAFVLNKSAIFIQGMNAQYIRTNKLNVSSYTISTLDISGSDPADSVLGGTVVEIRVYN